MTILTQAFISVRTRRHSIARLSLLDRKEQLEFRRELLLRVQAVREVDAANAAVGVNLHSESLDVVGAVCSAGKIRKVELDLIPALIQPHGHCANEGLNACCRLVVGGAEPAAHILVIKNLHLKSEVLLQVLNDHHEEWKLDAKGLGRFSWANDVAVADVRAHNFQHAGLNILIRNALQMPVFNLLLPYLQRL